MRRLFQDLSIMLRANLWLVPVLAALGTALFYFVAPPPPMQLRMSSGFDGGGYAAFAEQLQAELAKDGFELILEPSSGARENLARLLDEDSRIQIGLGQWTIHWSTVIGLAALGALYLWRAGQARPEAREIAPRRRRLRTGLPRSAPRSPRPKR